MSADQITRTTLIAEARKLERTRIRGIFDSSEAGARLKAAAAVAYETDMDVATAKRFLASLPKERNAGGDQFAAAMASLGNPAVGVDAVADGLGPAVTTIDAHSVYQSRKEQASSHAAAPENV